MKCFYHSADLDGHCSGAVVKYFYPDCEMWPFDYGYEYKFPWNKIKEGETVYMVDFHLQPFDLMLKLNNKAHLIWIDHHQLAIDEYHKVHLEEYFHMDGLRRVGIGACVLTWRYLTGQPVPCPVRLLAEYDVWNHSDPKTLPFQYGMRLRNTDPGDPNAMDLWTRLFEERSSSPIDTIIRDGHICLSYQRQLNARLCKEAFEIKFEGMKCLAINGRGNSQVFDPIWNPKKYDAMILFFMRSDRKWVVSLYTTHDHIDLGSFAKARGGGGHKKAAGFVCESLPF